MKEIFWKRLAGASISRKIIDIGYKREVLIHNGLSHHPRSQYEVNSIVCMERHKATYSHDIVLQYAFFDKKKMKITISKDEVLLIACSQSIMNDEEADVIRQDLIDFGKKLANYLGIEFFSYDIESTWESGELRLNSYDCNTLINNNPYLEERISEHKLDAEEYRPSKINTNNLTGNERGAINGNITRLIKRFNREVKYQIYCDECIKQIKHGYMNSLIEGRKEWKVQDERKQYMKD